MTLKFRRTHRLLMKASAEGFNYHTVDIDINHGTYYKTEVDSKDTLIRVTKGVFGEQFGYTENTALSVEQIQALESKFNSVRANNDWPALTFRIDNEDEDEAGS